MCWKNSRGVERTIRGLPTFSFHRFAAPGSFFELPAPQLSNACIAMTASKRYSSLRYIFEHLAHLLSS